VTNRRSLRIEQRGSQQQVWLDGHDVSHALVGADVRIHLGELPQAELQVRVIEYDTLVEPARVGIPAATHDLLVKLGWTPPHDDEQR
jgi:hypothetical protein